MEKVVGAMMLVAGGTVGAGIIALPVKTAAAGFIPTTFTLICSWMYMSITATLLIEASTWFGKGTNLTTMAQTTLGTVGKAICVSLYLVIYLATLTAYIAEGGRYLSQVVGSGLNPHYYCLPFVGILGAVVYKGTQATDKVNSLCLAFALCAYLFLLIAGGGAIRPSSLLVRNWGASVSTLPIMVVAFCYHNMVPSILSYLGNAQDAICAVVGGSAIPLAMYISWELVILGTLKRGGRSVHLTGAKIVEGLQAVAGSWATRALNWFSLMAIVTSFLGVTMGCLDFVNDLISGGKKPQYTQGNQQQEKLKAMFLTLVPALIVALSAPGIFYSAMEFSGTLRMVLFGVIPVFMVWRGRQKRGQKQGLLPGGRAMLAFCLTIAISMIFVEMRGKLIGLSLA
eukprot:TRINITY_DN11400_c1_g1_i3.p2 TRINITY_DN11400_c1_g1~~TRINITY_DN11400_c1_g1_i3.p2  ORF type:complete len:398 (-),score=51.75 TRINITY_DN11400_c1_g1_i3:978-2171(-)